jgi:hypothetical protein
MGAVISGAAELSKGVFGDSHSRKPAPVVHYLPDKFYHPLFGTREFIDHPQLTRNKTNYPVQKDFNPPTARLMGEWQKHPILSDPQFWQVWLARKYQRNRTYEPYMQLDHHHLPFKPELKHIDFALDERRSSYYRDEVIPNRPFENKGAVSFSSIGY